MFDENMHMEKYLLQEDLVLSGIEVKTFPNDIKETFDKLYDALGEERPYYGASWFDENGSIKYYAAAADLTSEEQKQFDCERLVIQKGEYHTVTITDWMNKLDSIKEAFQDLMKYSRPDRNNPCIEWYKSDDEMVCMVRA